MDGNATATHGFYFTDEHEEPEREQDVEANPIADDDDSPPISPREQPIQPSWPQSYRQSMDMYSHMASPNLPHLFISPLSGSRPSGSLLSPRPSVGTYRRKTPNIGTREDEQPLTGAEAGAAQQPVPVPEPRKAAQPERPPVPSPPLKHVEKQYSEEEEVYDTEPAGVTPQGSSFVQAMFNGVNVLAGVGILSTPYAVMKGGWVGLLLLFGFALICCYTGLVLRYCLDSQPGLVTYPDIGGAAFGRVGRLVISVVLYVELYACCVEFLILEGDNLAALFPHAALQFGTISLSPRHLFVLVSALAILPTVWLRDLSVLSYVSAGGVVASLVVVAAVFWVGAVDGVGFHQTGPLLVPWGLPVSIGLYGFCYSGHAVFPNLYTSLKNRDQYPVVLRTSFLVCTLIYGGMAVMGFLMFGKDTQAQITLNLPPHVIASEVAVWTTVVNPFTKYALTMTPVALCLEELLPMHPDSRAYRRASLCIRTALVASTIVVALLVPFFGYVMAFIGSFLSMSVSVVLPCACYLRILGKRATRSQAALCCAIMVVGVLCAVAGTWASVAGIINSLEHPDANDPNSFLAFFRR